MYRLFPRVAGSKRLLIYYRFFRFLLWEFRWPLFVFWLLVFSGGLILNRYYHAGGVDVSFARSCHTVFLMIFLESSLDFPEEWYLQPLFFLFPISLVRLAYLIFSRKQNLPEWNRIMASLCRNHIIVVGVGKVGYQVVRDLLDLRETVVPVDIRGDAPLLAELYNNEEVPVIQGNARMASTLEQAGIRWAKGVIVVTSDDLTNLDVAMTARELNAEARIVIRLFDETLARKIAGAFAMPAISTSQVAAPAFIAAATGRKVYQRFQVAGQDVQLTDLTIHESGKLVGKTVGEIQADRRVNVVMHHTESGDEIDPSLSNVLRPGDVILVIAAMNAMLELEKLNQPDVP